ncbi:beta-N-acetylhexosaminidase [Halococcus agarilyticus]|uniref:beta-N-acetylhexosaminidase n=1 Tax=Halococcus agarilyticus TaxID=1232219 RepID=UPI000677B4C8|nr:beta-N-acetylhexosaminidase [Halococcus agarilyticus]
MTDLPPKPESVVPSLSLPTKVGQLFVAGFDGTAPTTEIETLVAERSLGGVIYFSRNTESPAQLRALSRTLRGFVPDDAPPLSVAIDQEGGRVARLPWGTELPSAMALGATDDPELAARAGGAVGRELRSLGIDVNLAPVLDVNNNPDNPVIGIRSFGERPGRVAELGTAFADGLQSAGVVACGKHFPGHGDTAVDSHLDLPIVAHDRDRLDRVELRPFRRAIDDGIDAIMTTHVAFPAVAGDERPATLSRQVVDGLLREEFGFDGLVFTDCMEMDAIAEGVGTVEGCVQAVEAGCDRICVSHTPAKQHAAIDAVISAVESGRIPEPRIDAAVRRILRAKRAYRTEHLTGEDDDGGDEWEAAAADCRSIARTVAERGVTLVRNADHLPLPDRRVSVYEFETGDGSPAEEPRDDRGAFAAALSAAGVSVDATVLGDAGPSKTGIETDTANVPTVVRTSDAAGNPEQVGLVRDLDMAGSNPVVVATRNPYDLAAFPDIGTYLTTYDDTEASLAAAADVLVGTREPTGRLPITIPTAEE